MLPVAMLLAGCARTINHGGTAPACIGRISADTRVFPGDSLDIGPRMRRSPLIGYPPGWTVDRVMHVGARADLIDASVECMELVNVLDGFNRARFASDTKLLGAWEAARNLFGSFTRSEPASTDQSVAGEILPAPAADEKAA